MFSLEIGRYFCAGHFLKCVCVCLRSIYLCSVLARDGCRIASLPKGTRSAVAGWPVVGTAASTANCCTMLSPASSQVHCTRNPLAVLLASPALVLVSMA